MGTYFLKERQNTREKIINQFGLSESKFGLSESKDIRDDIQNKRGNTYICDECKGEFEYGWSEEEALKEKNENFGNIEGFSTKEDCGIVCDDCYKKVMRYINN